MRLLPAMSLFVAVALGNACEGPHGGTDGTAAESSRAQAGRDEEDEATGGDQPHPAYSLKEPQFRPPRRLEGDLPQYPQEAKEEGIVGVVVLEVSVERDGHVSAARALRGSGVLARAAEKAALTWRYEQPRIGNRPVPIKMIVAIRFTPERGAAILG
jgi:TonB family protein